jgi:transcriptional regulator with XRE-family HTH domain
MESAKKTKGSVVHPRIARAIAKLGADISLARRVRMIAAEDFAQRIGISRATLHRLENGDPGIAINTLALALHALGRLDALTMIADAANDHVTMMQMKEAAPKRISRPRARPKVPENLEINDSSDEAPMSKYVGF